MPASRRRTSLRTGLRGFTLVEIMIVVAIIGILLAIALPGWARARSVSRQRACQENLIKIDGAKEQWALENRKTADAAPNSSELYKADFTGYLKNAPLCPSNGSYTIGSITAAATCSITEPVDHNEKR